MTRRVQCWRFQSAPLGMILFPFLVLATYVNNALSNILPQEGFSSEHIFGKGGSDGLRSLSEDNFTLLRHGHFDGYRVRVKKTRFCDSTVQGYTGYIDVGAKHLFFYFFESRSDPANDDVMLWTNGGPGASSSMGLFMENGPCRISDDLEPKYHPESWNTNANIFFIDQPAGVGYSYSDFGETVTTSEEAAKDIAAFLIIFFEHFTQFKGRKFHLSGESFAGRYLPLFAGAILDQNRKLVQAGLTPINLQSLLIGNGWTSPQAVIPTYYDILCTHASVPPVLSVDVCVSLRVLAKRCKTWLVTACVDNYDLTNCNAASNACMSVMGVEYGTNARGNPYDVTKKCDITREDGCYAEFGYIEKYLSKPHVRKQLGSDRNFTANDDPLHTAFEKTGDLYKPSTDHLSQVLERGVRVLIYAGTYDVIANHIGNERFTLDLEWSGQVDFVKQPLRDWFVDGKVAGRTRSSHGFTYASVYGGGHLVPYDKPKEALALLQRWLAGEEL